MSEGLPLVLRLTSSSSSMSASWERSLVARLRTTGRGTKRKIEKRLTRARLSSESCQKMKAAVMGMTSRLCEG